MLLGSGVDLNAMDDEEMTVILAVFKAGKEEAVESLLKALADR